MAKPRKAWTFSPGKKPKTALPSTLKDTLLRKLICRLGAALIGPFSPVTHFGSRTRPENSTALVFLSLMKNRKGWSALKTFGSRAA